MSPHNQCSQPAPAQDPPSEPAVPHDPRSEPAAPHDQRSEPAPLHDQRLEPAVSHDPRSEPASGMLIARSTNLQTQQETECASVEKNVSSSSCSSSSQPDSSFDVARAKENVRCGAAEFEEAHEEEAVSRAEPCFSTEQHPTPLSELVEETEAKMCSDIVPFTEAASGSEKQEAAWQAPRTPSTEHGFHFDFGETEPDKAGSKEATLISGVESKLEPSISPARTKKKKAKKKGTDHLETGLRHIADKP